MSKITDKQALAEWEEFLLQIKNATPIDTNETDEEKRKRIKRLEAPGNHEEWFTYYFPKYSFAEPAPFHLKSSSKFLKCNRVYHRRAWARGLSKSTRRMFDLFYRHFVQKRTKNMLLCSKNEENAIRLLAPYRANLEANQRLINDYGKQQRLGTWESNRFTTRSGWSFVAVGSGQNPRGTKNEEIRVDTIVLDDLDDDEVCRNPDRLEQVWKWVEEAVIPTVEISKDYAICVDNNIIAEDSIAVRAGKMADLDEVVNIRDENGKSTWPTKNKESDIDDILSKISYEAGQKEYFNNPMDSGKTFPEITWGKCPPIHTLSFVVVYADPSTSNRDKPTAKSKANNSAKAVFIIGEKDDFFYVYKGFLDNTSNSVFIDWLYDCRTWIKDKVQAYFYIENNTLQDPFYEQVLLPLIYAKGKDYNGILSVMGDDRQKPDKWFRIEGTLEPINRMGRLIFNIAEKENPHMKKLEAQFKAAKPTSKTLDGPDAVEGGVWITKTKKSVMAVGGIQAIKRKPNNKRF